MAHDWPVVSRRRKYLVLVVVGSVVLGVVSVFLFGREREPEYGGRRLTEWVEKFWSPPYTNYSAQTAEAKDAIHQIGTNALPYLLKWVGYERPAWKAKLYRMANPILRSLNLSFQMTDKKDIRLARGAVNALIALGRNADGAIGELRRLMDMPSGAASAGRAAMVLGGLKYPSGAEGSLLLNAIVSEIRDLHLDSPQSHPGFSFTKFEASKTNDWTSGIFPVKLTLDPPTSRHVTFAIIPAKTNSGMSSAFPRMPRAKTNAVADIHPQTWIKKSWY